MQLTFLGTGSAMPTGQRAQSGVLVVDGDDALLVDCGSGVLNALARTSVGYEGVDAVVITHHHLDHVSDLLALLKARWLAGETALTVAGPPGTTALVSDLLDVHDYLRGRVDLELRDVSTAEPFSLAGFELAAQETIHSMQTFAYRIGSKGAADVPVEGTEEPGEAAVESSETADELAEVDAGQGGVDTDGSQAVAEGGPVVLGADSEADEDLVEFADGAAVLVHDCSFPDDVDVANHPTATELGRALATADADVGRVYLTHFYPHAHGRTDELVDCVTDQYDGDVRAAHDGLVVTVEADETVGTEAED